MNRSRPTSSRWNAGVRALLVGLTGLALVQCREPSQPTELGSGRPKLRAAAASGGPFAYVVNSGDNTVSVIDLTTNAVVGSPIAVDATPRWLAITPDGTRAYVTADSSVTVIDLATNRVIGAPIAAGFVWDVAITPDGARAYVAANSNSVRVIDLATNTVIGAPIRVGDFPSTLAITPDGARAYVLTYPQFVRVIDLATNTVIGAPILLGHGLANDVAITPDGTRAYVTHFDNNSVSEINLLTEEVSGTIDVGSGPLRLAITPDGARAYVPNFNVGNVSAIDLATNTVVGSTIEVGSGPTDVSITSDGARAYVTNVFGNSVSVIDIATNTRMGSPIRVGLGPAGIAITPGRTLTPAGHFAVLQTAVIDLLAAGSLDRKQAVALTERLDHALAQLLAGHAHDAVRRLQRFVNDVNRLIREGVLTPAEGQPLLDNANGAIFLLS